MFYQNAITLPTLRMRALISLLEKVQSQTVTKNMTDADVLALRLAPDMFHFGRQIQIVSDNAKGIVSRLTNKEAPKYEDNEATLAELITRLEKTIAYLATFSESDFADAVTAEARFPYFPGKKVVGETYLINYGLPNLFFHIVTAYAILRQHGFDIGKGDYMGNETGFIDDIA